MTQKIMITGGAGFIGVNAAGQFLRDGWQVVIVDNLCRRGAELNLAWLQQQHSFEFEKVDVRSADQIAKVVRAHLPDVVLHLAAQVAVTTSVADPRDDFEVNALGTLNLLEAVRLHSPDSFFINASTNKVYGKMAEHPVVERNGRYEYQFLQSGVPETQNLDFHSPYGCSKGVADQYTIDYSRVYGLETVTLRQSCIYGPRQFGIEDQGWVAWFTIAALLDKSITVYGDGKQIRDVLHVDDLVLAYKAAIGQRSDISGQAINIGGGPANTLSLLELLNYLREQLDKEITPAWDDWRPGDQPVFVCDLDRAQQLLRWQPTISVDAGVVRLIEWVGQNSELFD
ncbi:MAG: SDR family NAD(P)-dependent oxidoreductase [Gammaproteobacteria bacterium]|nr:SDR family NAD(P)-dependent oxidoreductase [Gammaproteobacteria bacterium]